MEEDIPKNNYSGRFDETLLSQLNQSQKDYIIKQKFTREKFIKELKGFHEYYDTIRSQVSKSEYKEIKKEKLNLRIEDINTLSDLQLIKAHKYYWDLL